MSEPQLLHLSDLVDELVEDSARRHEAWKERQKHPVSFPRIKVYRRHYCQRTHKTYKTMAGCLWRQALVIWGEGPFALLAWCGEGLTISLHATLDKAVEDKDRIDGGCGTRCDNRHEIVQMVDPRAAEYSPRRKRMR